MWHPHKNDGNTIRKTRITKKKLKQKNHVPRFTKKETGKNHLPRITEKVVIHWPQNQVTTLLRVANGVVRMEFKDENGPKRIVLKHGRAYTSIMGVLEY